MDFVTRNPNSAITAPDISIVGDRDTGFRSPSADKIQIVAGGVAVAEYDGASTNQTYGVLVHSIPLVGDTLATTRNATLNPFGYDVMILGAYLQVTTQSSVASTFDIGVAANATTTNDGLFDGVAGTAAGLFTNFEDAGTNGEVSQLWGSTQYLNVTEVSGAAEGMVATLKVLVCRV